MIPQVDQRGEHIVAQYGHLGRRIVRRGAGEVRAREPIFQLEHDPFRGLLGPEWQKYHWFATAVERDRALEEMSRKHEYSRTGDRPALVFVKVEKLAESRSL